MPPRPIPETPSVLKAIRLPKGNKFVIRVYHDCAIVGEIGGARAARNGFVVVRQSARYGDWSIDGSRQDRRAAERLRDDCLSRRGASVPVANPDGSYRLESYFPNAAALVLEVEN